MANFLAGKKTYITAAVIAVVVGLYQAGIIDKNVYDALIGVLAALGITTLRAGLDNANNRLLNK